MAMLSNLSSFINARVKALNKHAFLKKRYVRPHQDKNNYQPTNTLPNILKIFERYMYLQISEYFEDNILVNINMDLEKVTVWSIAFY